MMEWAKTVKYVKSRYENGTFTFAYVVDGQDLVITLSHNTTSNLPLETIERIGFHLGMCYLMDIAEIVIPKQIWIFKKLPPVALDYWIKLYEEQVIEKCYALKIPTFIKNVEWRTGAETPEVYEPIAISGKRDSAALCLTGGKESLAILKTLESKKPLLLFFLDPETNVHRQRVFQTVEKLHPTIKTISNRSEILAPYEKRYKGLQSGVDMAHLVFNTMLYADICEYVLIGNEYSSNYPNDVYEGNIVNHQFVKTIHFAENLNRYIQEFVTKDFTYYSPFFGLYEYKIADLLFKDEKYLDVWTSCNQTTQDINFCSQCSKCAFTYLIARTKKSDAFLAQFFSHNVLNDVELFKPMMDFVGKKPLDCVGDKTEVWVACEFLLENNVSNATINYYQKNIRPHIISELDEYKSQVTSIQRVPVSTPDDIQKLIYDALQT